jgi:protein involved in polysaccharide export with SLBB domain
MVALAALCACLLTPYGARGDTEYTLAPHDVIAIQVVGVDALSREVTVLGDGTISYPLVGTVKAEGLTLDALREIVAGRLESYVREPRVAVSVVRAAQMTVLVLGNVKQPGRYALDRGARLSDALAAAGGIAQSDGPLPEARIGAAGDAPRTVALERMMRAGTDALDVPLHDRDVVYISSPTTFTVTIAGSVEHPGSVTVQDGDRVSTAIARAGIGTGSQGDLSHVRFTRVDDEGHSRSANVDVVAALQRGDFREDPVLHKGDVIFVPPARRGALAAVPEQFYYVLAGLRVLFLHF